MNSLVSAFKNALSAFSMRPLWQRRAVFGIIGAVGGLAYYHYIGCTSGSCPITGNPSLSSAYGALIGLLVPVQEEGN
jgi:hypothetical protein